MKTSDTGGLSGIGGARLQPDIIQFHEPNLGLERLLFRPARGIAFFMERQQCVCTNRFVARGLPRSRPQSRPCPCPLSVRANSRASPAPFKPPRSEERRVGKECGSRWWRAADKKKGVWMDVAAAV